MYFKFAAERTSRSASRVGAWEGSTSKGIVGGDIIGVYSTSTDRRMEEKNPSYRHGCEQSKGVYHNDGSMQDVVTLLTPKKNKINSEEIRLKNWFRILFIISTKLFATICKFYEFQQLAIPRFHLFHFLHFFKLFFGLYLLCQFYA